jgi:hypothetical protein
VNRYEQKQQEKKLLSRLHCNSYYMRSCRSHSSSTFHKHNRASNNAQSIANHRPQPDTIAPSNRKPNTDCDIAAYTNPFRNICTHTYTVAFPFANSNAKRNLNSECNVECL